MARKVVHNSGQAQLFKNKYVEMLTKTNPLVIWGFYIPVLSYVLYKAHVNVGLSITTIILLFFAGMLYWTFFEYLAHRYLFHWVSDNMKAKKVAYILHGNHHEYPRDRQRLFMPLVPSIILATTLFSIHYLFLWDYNWAFFPGFMQQFYIFIGLGMLGGGNRRREY